MSNRSSIEFRADGSQRHPMEISAINKAFNQFLHWMDDLNGPSQDINPKTDLDAAEFLCVGAITYQKAVCEGGALDEQVKMLCRIGGAVMNILVPSDDDWPKPALVEDPETKPYNEFTERLYNTDEFCEHVVINGIPAQEFCVYDGELGIEFGRRENVTVHHLVHSRWESIVTLSAEDRDKLWEAVQAESVSKLQIDTVDTYRGQPTFSIFDREGYRIGVGVLPALGSVLDSVADNNAEEVEEPKASGFPKCPRCHSKHKRSRRIVPVEVSGGGIADAVHAVTGNPFIRCPHPWHSSTR